MGSSMIETLETQTKPENEVEVEHDINDLNLLYSEGDSADQVIFAEMRSNLLLVAGEHYNKRESLFFRRIRDSKELSQEQKLRLTKNHIRKICQTYVNNIMAPNPGVGFEPKNEKELHDQKVADLHHAVWRDAVERYNIDDLMDDWADNFVEIGEVHVKIFWDPSKGKLKGYSPLMGVEGQPELNEMGQYQPDTEQPIHEGAFEIEDIYGFNLLRPVACRDLRKAEWLGIRKMVNKDDLLLKFKDEELQRFIKESQDDSYVVFDASFGGYYKPKNQVSVREFFFRPCLKYPQGYFYITTKEGILSEGELPGGIFPIVTQIFDKVQTTPRGRSPIKQMRPYQAEINRSGSKMAEHQITLGDDKLLIQNGTKVSGSASLPGIRAYSYTGAEPKILEGRSGAQYLDYMNSQIAELYSVMNVAEDSEENTANLDPYVLLYRAARDKKKFQRYIKRFEQFLVQFVKTYLSLAKVHLDDEALIYAIGSTERVNVPEFKKMADICYEIKVEAQSEDSETKLGKQIVLNHTLQYVGGQLKPEDIGKMMRAMPFANFDQSFDDMTIDYDNSVNDVLALERGDRPPVGQNDDHKYQIKRLTARMKKSDFKYLSPPIQQAFQDKINMHQQIMAFQEDQLRRAEAGFIPTSGDLVAMDFYAADPSDPTGVKTRRARLPYAAIQWLIQQLEVQGQSQEQFAELDMGNQSQIAQKLNGMPGPGGPGMPQPQGGMPPRGAPMAGQPMGHPQMGAPNGMGQLLSRMPAGMGR